MRFYDFEGQKLLNFTITINLLFTTAIYDVMTHFVNLFLGLLVNMSSCKNQMYLMASLHHIVEWSKPLKLKTKLCYVQSDPK